MATTTHKTRFRLEQVKGGDLYVKDNEASAMSIQSNEASNIKFLEVDSRTGAERIVLGDSDAKVEVDGALQIDGAVSGSQIGLGQGKLLLQANNDLVDDDFLRIAGTGIEGLNAAEMRDQLSLDTDDTPQFTGLELGHASDTTISRPSGGDIAVEGNIVYRAGGTDVPVADGGTGLSAIAKGSVLVANSANTLSALDGGGTASGVLAYVHGSDTVEWKASGIANANAVIIDGASNAPQDNDYAKFTTNGLEGMSFSQVMGDLSGAAGADFSMNSKRITSLGEPVDNSDAATKRYVDHSIEGLKHKEAVKISTTGAILGHDNAYVPDFQLIPTGGANSDIKNLQDAGNNNKDMVALFGLNGRSGIRSVVNASGNYGTAAVKMSGLNAALDSVGASLQRGDRILVANESDANDKKHHAAHGIYEVIHTGADTAQDPGFFLDWQGMITNLSQQDYIEFMLVLAKDSQDGADGTHFSGNATFEAEARHRFRIGFKNSGNSDAAFGDKGAGPLKIEGVHSAQLSFAGGKSDATLAADMETLLDALGTKANGNPFNGFTAVRSGGGQNLELTFAKTTAADPDFDIFVDGTDHFMGVDGKSPDLTVKQYAPSQMGFILARTDDADGSSEKYGELDGGAFTFVTHGTALANCGFVMSSDAAYGEKQQLDSGTQMTWTQFSSSGVSTANNGVSKTGNNFELAISTIGVEKNADIDGADRLAIADSANGNATKWITFTNVAGKLDGAGLTAASGVLSVDANQDGQITSATGLAAVGTLNAGSISSGFGAIDNGASNITTTGLISGGSLDIDDVLINGAVIGHSADGDLITLANQSVALANDVDFNVAKAGGLQLAGSAVTATAAMLNLLDTGVVNTSVTIQNTDNIIIFDDDAGDVAKKIKAEDLKAFVSGGTVKVISELTGGLSANQPWNPGSGGMDAFPTGFAADNGDKTELYLNGMLLMRDTNGTPGAGNKDYYNDSGSLKFEFDLESGDILQFIKRA